jgi:hypothetical protein
MMAYQAFTTKLTNIPSVTVTVAFTGARTSVRANMTLKTLVTGM